jgi:hypothetical protein
MLRQINNEYVNLNLIEVVRPIETDGKVTDYEIILVSGRTYMVNKKVGDSIRLAMNGRNAKVVVEQAAPKKSTADLQTVLQAARNVNSPFKR